MGSHRRGHMGPEEVYVVTSYLCQFVFLCPGLSLYPFHCPYGPGNDFPCKLSQCVSGPCARIWCACYVGARCLARGARTRATLFFVNALHTESDGVQVDHVPAHAAALSQQQEQD